MTYKPYFFMLPQLYITVSHAYLTFPALRSWLVRAFSKAGPVAARGITKYYRKKLVKTAFSKVLAAAPLAKPLTKPPQGARSPPLTTTAVQLMDFMLPSCAVAWGYWFIMLQHAATILNAYLPELLFVGAVSSIRLLLHDSNQRRMCTYPVLIQLHMCLSRR
jgi:hypothetical protein